MPNNKYFACNYVEEYLRIEEVENYKISNGEIVDHIRENNIDSTTDKNIEEQEEERINSSKDFNFRRHKIVKIQPFLLRTTKYC